MNNGVYRNNITDNKSYTINNDRELFLIEYLYGNNTIKFSYIKDNKFHSTEHGCILDILDRLITCNKECKLIVDALPNDICHIKDFINKHELDFVIEKPTVDDVKKMRIHKLTLIGFYINERKLIPM